MLPPSLPRAPADQGFFDDPIRYLRRARGLGALVVLREAGPIFSRDPACTGVVAAFGAEVARAVLSDGERYGLPPSAAGALGLEGRLARLNRSLHSMRGAEHASHRRALAAAIEGRAGLHRALAAEAIQAELAGWRTGQVIGLKRALRKLASQVAARVLFGAAADDDLIVLLEGWNRLRREAAAGGVTSDALQPLGLALDAALRAHLRQARGGGLLAALAHGGLSEDDLVGHGNILYVSATEPVAAALAWTLILLSSRPHTRAALRAEGARGEGALLDGVLLESARLLPPNALMVRRTLAEVALDGVPLPERCEILLSPFVAHRDPTRFPDPDAFRPERWAGPAPGPYEFLPFGGGEHRCVGRSLAMDLLRAGLGALLERFDPVLAEDQELDWTLHVQLSPTGDPSFLLEDPSLGVVGGRLLGPVAALLSAQDA